MSSTITIPETIPERDIPVLLVGNPNVGKSVLFGKLTGRYVTVANYPGTTVELTRGALPDGTPLIDTPGLNTLTGKTDDERVTREVLRHDGPRSRAVVQVADAKNLHRALLLTLQLVEMGIPLVLDLNMTDEAQANGVKIDIRRLSERLKLNVVSTIATRSEGLDQLLEAIDTAQTSSYSMRYDQAIEAALARIEDEIPPELPYRRALALWLLAGDEQPAFQYHLDGFLPEMQRALVAHYGLPLSVVLTRQRLKTAGQILEGVLLQEGSTETHILQRLSPWTTHSIAGWPILALVLLAVYGFVGQFGAGTLVDIMEGTLFGRWINPWATHWLDRFVPSPLIHDLLVGEYGLITMALSYGMAIVLPIVTTFFIAFGILEDSGYLPRLAVMLNRSFKAMGLNGKAVLPMVLGLGCDTMATLTTRILETRKERILVTLLLALGVPCSAQLGVILGMMGVISFAGVLLWAGVVIMTMLIVGHLAARALPGEPSDFILELPPLRHPQIGNIVLKTAARVEWYLKEVLPLFGMGTLFLLIMHKSGAMTALQRATAPIIVGWLQLPAEATDAFLIGFLRRDYGAAGLFALARSGQLDTTQVIVSLIVITLFMPCIANVLIIVKEYGSRVAAAVSAVVFPLAFAIGGLVNIVLRVIGVKP